MLRNVSTSEDLRTKAARCLRLARSAKDEPVAQALRDLAAQYMERADAVEQAHAALTVQQQQQYKPESRPSEDNERYELLLITTPWTGHATSVPHLSALFTLR